MQNKHRCFRFAALCTAFALIVSCAAFADDDGPHPATADDNGQQDKQAAAQAVSENAQGAFYQNGNGVELYPEEQRELREKENAHLPEILRTSPAPETDTTSADYDTSWVTKHTYTGKKVTQIPEELRTVDTRGGVLLKPNVGSWDFSKKGGVDYGSNRNIAELEWVDLGGGRGATATK